MIAVPLVAQSNGANYVQDYGRIIETPKIQLGSSTEPSIIMIPPVVEVTPGQPAAPRVSNAAPASTELLASRHFDYIVSPLEKIVPGSMEDTSISLGEYARQLRASKSHAPTPDAMAKPTESH